MRGDTRHKMQNVTLIASLAIGAIWAGDSTLLNGQSSGCADYRISSTFDCGSCEHYLLKQVDEPSCIDLHWTLFFGVEGSKQPQDFGVNANLGGRARVNFSGPLFQQHGIGYQIGSAYTASANAVQVFEMLGESTGRVASMNTIGIFQRRPTGFSVGAVYDYLYLDSIDRFDLGQLRLRASQELGSRFEVGATVNLSVDHDLGRFNDTVVQLEAADQFNVFFRWRWLTGVSTTAWVGQALSHGEDNVIAGAQPRKENTILLGADLRAPLNDRMAIYGETNLISPADTGAVDAFLGIEILVSPANSSLRLNRFRPLLPVASSTSFTTDLRIID